MLSMKRKMDASDFREFKLESLKLSSQGNEVKISEVLKFATLTADSLFITFLPKIYLFQL